MARLRNVETGAEVVPDEVHAFGRAPVGGGTVVDDASVSRVHAAVTWNDGYWSVTDLGSRNGTVVSGLTLEPRERRALVVGDLVRFGRAPAWRVERLDPPVARASSVDGAREALGLDDLLLLPDADAPELVIRRSPAGWTALGPDAARPVADGDRVDAGGISWRVRLPGGVGATEQESAEAWRLTLRVNEDDGRVAATVHHGATVFDLGMRAHLRIFVPLARERGRALRRGVPDHEAGWVACEDLAMALDVREQLVYLHLWRLRAQVDAIGLPPALAVLERRATGEVRVGTANVVVEPL